jgi:hypothetical protein
LPPRESVRQRYAPENTGTVHSQPQNRLYRRVGETVCFNLLPLVPSRARLRGCPSIVGGNNLQQTGIAGAVHAHSSNNNTSLTPFRPFRHMHNRMAHDRLP